VQTPLCNEINHKVPVKNCVGDHVTEPARVTAASGGDLGGASLFIQLMNQKAENGCCSSGQQPLHFRTFG
jgi:hypothetical protein